MVEKINHRGRGEHRELLFSLFSLWFSEPISEDNKKRFFGNSRCKRLVDELCLRDLKCLEITNDTNKRISRMLNQNKFVPFVHS